MHPILTSIARVFLVPAVLLTFCVAHSKAEDTIAFEDDFSTVKGFRTTETNGAEEEVGDKVTRQNFLFMSESIVGGKLSMTALEDDKTAGADGKVGVMSYSYDQVPITADFSGFVYVGRKDEQIKMKQFNGNVDRDQLKKTTVSFRYKAANANESNVGAEYNFRIENDVEQSYEWRVDFGSMTATDQWQTFKRSLGDDANTNTSEFIRSINRAPDAPLKLVWGQEGEVSSYDDGDTLLIDDVSITVAK